MWRSTRFLFPYLLLACKAHLASLNSARDYDRLRLTHGTVFSREPEALFKTAFSNFDLVENKLRTECLCLLKELVRIFISGHARKTREVIDLRSIDYLAAGSFTFEHDNGTSRASRVDRRRKARRTCTYYRNIRHLIPPYFLLVPHRYEGWSWR